MTKQEIKSLIETLSGIEVVVEHNDGTFGATECQRAVGTGDPKYGLYTIYERVGDGKRRVEGCDPAKAPGYSRGTRADLNAKRAELKRLKSML